MPGASLSLGHLYVVRWDTITTDDFNALLVKLKGIREATGKDVVYVAIQDDHYKAPDAATTEVMKQRFGEFADLIKADYIVMSAKGVKSSLQRSFLRAAIVGGSLVGVKGVDKVVVVSTLDEVFAKEAGNLPSGASDIMESLQKADALPRS